MCGIAGLIYKKGKKVSEDILVEMGDSIAHRGPNAAGTFLENQVGFVHRRLSILDLSEAGNQPYHSACNRFVLVFNGEIFNFKEFYPELKNKGYSFHSTSDTEVLLYLLMEDGLQVLERLNGFFAFSLWDREKNELTLVRDRFGVKPLFVYNDSELFTFGSEPKALFKAGAKKEINDQALSELFYYRYVAGERTMFKGVKRILPGYYIKVNGEGEIIEEKRWFSLKDAAQKHQSISDPYQWYEETFHKSIAYRMISDVPVGTLLSGGLDSSSVLYSQVDQGYKGLSAWNISFQNYQHDESTVAGKFANSLGVDFHTREFKGEELMGLVLESIKNHDEPLMHLQDGHILGISRYAKEKVSVLLSGEGADEILGGYVRYKVHDKAWRYQLLQTLQYVPDRFLNTDRIKKMKRYLKSGKEEFQMMSNSNEIFLDDFDGMGVEFGDLKVDFRQKILDEAKSLYPANRFRQLLYLEQHTHLYTLNDRNDRTTMGASIECRDPFLDPNLVIGVASLEDRYFDSEGKGKKLLFNSIGRHLPDYITKHPKIGLSVPWNEYFIKQDEFKSHFDQLEKSPIFEAPLFQKMNISKIKSDFIQDNTKNYGLMRQFFFLSLWYKVHFE
ncbi:asparagine synthase (glutamine-hydrolyzing) [Algoriphagus aestuarii]|nr:asparagine synthase (glutamine-hydrolyzing) [Algoriphagus aestuarii]